MINIYISKKGGKYYGTCTEYPSIETICKTYKECRDYMVNTIIQRQNEEFGGHEKKEEKRKPKLGFAA